MAGGRGDVPRARLRYPRSVVYLQGQGSAIGGPHPRTHTPHTHTHTDRPRNSVAAPRNNMFHPSFIFAFVQNPTKLRAKRNENTHIHKSTRACSVAVGVLLFLFLFFLLIVVIVVILRERRRLLSVHGVAFPVKVGPLFFLLHLHCLFLRLFPRLFLRRGPARVELPLLRVELGVLLPPPLLLVRALRPRPRLFRSSPAHGRHRRRLLRLHARLLRGRLGRLLVHDDADDGVAARLDHHKVVRLRVRDALEAGDDGGALGGENTLGVKLATPIRHHLCGFVLAVPAVGREGVEGDAAAVPLLEHDARGGYRVGDAALFELAACGGHVAQKLVGVREARDVVHLHELGRVAQANNLRHRRERVVELFDFDGVAERCGCRRLAPALLRRCARKDDTGRVDELHVLVELHLLRGFRKPGRCTHRHRARSLKAVDQRALAHVRQPHHPNCDCLLEVTVAGVVFEELQERVCAEALRASGDGACARG
mmetsp:Transcript_16355/g.53442  ORF Transcript_16355/g.53442 Transcript_16355/m.53442 type:complete len:482 (-) Transcript_16355:778-2223(-)